MIGLTGGLTDKRIGSSVFGGEFTSGDSKVSATFGPGLYLASVAVLLAVGAVVLAQRSGAAVPATPASVTPPGQQFGNFTNFFFFFFFAKKSF